YKIDFIEGKASQNPERIVKLHRGSIGAHFTIWDKLLERSRKMAFPFILISHNATDTLVKLSGTLSITRQTYFQLILGVAWDIAVNSKAMGSVRGIEEEEVLKFSHDKENDCES
ncbi:hypothetical protein P7K49_032143, partial [Saguinus oedipus]